MPNSNAFRLGNLLGPRSTIDFAYSSLTSIPSNILRSNISGITGADVISNIVSLTQAEYDAISTSDSATLYVITG